ncbi:uncharacterized protein Z518_06303 [Rhinocladiella mackenziei CBS 650.93]|uniref:SET domain-containing protein n=1 Tax=Rhinocladiella mackenziei CBS 650.93 TaxID=1442369 RepID=A0A0D2IQH8_9EURO|nr:uncharacterized protein Z518_06303 [Rhinocladiella mackenziei CBS 650.93]KIX05431.1 hypothetical protein Z518_06303 [Rhinocladiella mackenziei CBS 650.93]
MKQVSLPLETLQAWSHFNNIQLFGASVEPQLVTGDGIDKGGGLVANTDLGPGEPILAVPLELVLSKERVEECAKSDKHLRELIDAAGPLFQVGRRKGDGFYGPHQNPRAAVLLFLVYQMTINSSDSESRHLGLKTPFADYLKFLPKDTPLPTFYTLEERELLIGTSLSEALEQKLSSLEREFDRLRAATETIPWCRDLWWDELTGHLDIGDWKLADAVYRSRALELPRGATVGMVPVVDMANHASDDRYNARFEVDDDAGSVLLVVRDRRSIRHGDEITIMYGAGGVCEMVFSYGFLEEHVSSAREIFLNLSIPADDPLRMAKIRFAQEAPGVRIYVDDSDQVHWESTFVWWTCVNQEDGLDFQVEQTVNGDTELKATWKQNDLHAGALHSLLLQDRIRDVFVLRAVVIVQQKVENQGMRLAASEDDFDNTVVNGQVRQSVYETIGRLRKLELELLTRAFETLEKEKARLLESNIVRDYLEHGADSTGEYPDDFS